VTITGAAFEYQLINAVSAALEPSTWLLMIAGVGGIGLMLRRAKTALSLRSAGAVAV